MIAAAEGKHLNDVISHNLSILFSGINPSLYSAAVGRHFARKNNRFWSTLHQAGLTPRLFSPFEENKLLEHGMGLTDVVERATRAESNLSITEKRRGIKLLRKKLVEYKPRVIAFVGIGVYRDAFMQRNVKEGLQPFSLAGSAVFVLPSTSGLNATWTSSKLTAIFKELKEFAYKEGELELGPELEDVEVEDDEVTGQGEEETMASPKKKKEEKKLVAEVKEETPKKKKRKVMSVEMMTPPASAEKKSKRGR